MGMESEFQPEPDQKGGLFCAVAGGVAFGYVASLWLFFHQHVWVIAASGLPVPSDFLAYWSAGRMALMGKAATAYDPNALHALQMSIAGHFSGYFYWGYPPVFLFVAVVLASLPFGVAYIGWVLCTAAAFSWAVSAVVRGRASILFALASPAALITAYTGQSGFLTAALFGAFLLAMPYRPIVSGILLGFMIYKPQFGILLPIVLLVSGQWRCIISASATVFILATLSVLVFGVGTTAQFLHSLALMSNAYLKLGGEGWAKIHSAYGVARFLGATDQAAWFAQMLVTVLSAGAGAVLWKSKAAFPVKSAALLLAAMLSTPYLHGYDFPVLIMALAFLYLEKPFDFLEWIAALLVNLVIAGFILELAPIGPIAIAVVCWMTGRRLLLKSADEVAARRPVLSGLPA